MLSIVDMERVVSNKNSPNCFENWIQFQFCASFFYFSILHISCTIWISLEVQLKYSLFMHLRLFELHCPLAILINSHLSSSQIEIILCKELSNYLYVVVNVNMKQKFTSNRLLTPQYPVFRCLRHSYISFIIMKTKVIITYFTLIILAEKAITLSLYVNSLI